MASLARPSPLGSDESDTHARCDVIGKPVVPPGTCAEVEVARTGSWRSKSGGAPTGRSKHEPTPDEMAALVEETRAHLAPDAAAVDRLLVQGGEQGVTAAQLRRWLRARGFDPARAARDLSSHATWRAKFVPAGRVLESEVPNELAQKKAFLQGPDRQGRAVTVFIGGNHTPRDAAETQRFIYYSIDATVALSAMDPVRNPLGKTAGILCMKDFGLRNMDIMGGINIARAVHLHYVELLDVLYIHGTGAAFQRAFKLVEPFIDPVTARKIVLLPRDEAVCADILDRDLGLENLPAFLGGTAELRPIEAAWAEILERRAAAGGADAAPPAPSSGANESEDEFFDAAAAEEGA